MKLLSFLVLTILVLSQNNLHAQFEAEPYKAPNNVTEDIESQMNAKYGGTYTLTIYFIMDSLIDKIPFDYMDEKYEDPYGTLKGVSVFSCQKNTDSEDSSIVGVYKDGNILWDSGPIIFGNILSRLSFCKDINKDSTVDIGLISEKEDFSENYNPNNVVDYLWILSWNGSNGKFINDYDPGTDKSKLVPGPFKLFDENGDGVYEISSMYSYDDEYTHTPIENPPPNYPYVTYGWNGSKYGLWPSVHQLKEGDFYPAIWIEPTIKCRVTSEDSSLKFQYTVTNGKNSLQQIESIYITNIAVDKVEKDPEYQDSIISSSGIITNSWCFNPTLQSYASLIDPGETRSDYWYKGTGLPSICEAYFQGLVPVELTRPTTDTLIINGIYNNSVKRKTIGLRTMPQQLDTLGFLDTLRAYTDSSYSLGWIKNQTTANKYTNYFTTAKTQLQQNNITGVKSTLNQVLQDVNQDSTSNLTSEAYALIRYNTEYMLAHLPNSNPPSLGVKLENSSGSLLTGGTLQYYDGGWKDATNNGDGTFGINTTKSILSLRMTYAYGSQTVSNISAQNNTYTFQTKDVSVQLKNSIGSLIDTGTVQYYAGTWRDFGTTTNGVATKELLPNTYSFRMTYAHASNDKQQDIGTNSTVIFQTVKANVQLQNSQGTPLDTGTVQYYAGAWRNIGTTANGSVSVELLPKTYSFRMTYDYISNDKQQNIGTDNVVKFSTVLCTISVNNSQNQPVSGADIKYYAGAWREIGQTVNGQITKELLPKNISFRMNYNSVQQDKSQNISTNPLVQFNTSTQ